MSCKRSKSLRKDRERKKERKNSYLITLNKNFSALLASKKKEEKKKKLIQFDSPKICSTTAIRVLNIASRIVFVTL